MPAVARPVLQKPGAHARLFSRERTLSVRILTDVNVGSDLRGLLRRNFKTSVRILTDSILYRENKRAWTRSCRRQQNPKTPHTLRPSTRTRFQLPQLSPAADAAAVALAGPGVAIVVGGQWRGRSYVERLGHEGRMQPHQRRNFLGAVLWDVATEKTLRSRWQDSAVPCHEQRHTPLPPQTAREVVAAAAELESESEEAEEEAASRRGEEGACVCRREEGVCVCRGGVGGTLNVKELSGPAIPKAGAKVISSWPGPYSCTHSHTASDLGRATRVGPPGRGERQGEAGRGF